MKNGPERGKARGARGGAFGERDRICEGGTGRRRQSDDLWQVATLAEQRQIAHTLLDAIYLDVDHRPVVAIVPKTEFAPFSELAAEGLIDTIAGDTAILPPGNQE